MRILLFSILSIMILAPVSSMALEPVNEAHAMIYYQIPFSASKAKEKKHSFGFRMDHTSYEHGGMISYQKLMNQTAALDFKMGHDGVQGMYVSGVDFLQRYRLARAAEDDAMEANDEAMEESMDEAMDEPGESMESGDVAMEKTEKKPGAVAKIGTDVSNTVEDIIATVPLGFMIGGIIAIVLITGAGG